MDSKKTPSLWAECFFAAHIAYPLSPKAEGFLVYDFSLLFSKYVAYSHIEVPTPSTRIAKELISTFIETP